MGKAHNSANAEIFSDSLLYADLCREAHLSALKVAANEEEFAEAYAGAYARAYLRIYLENLPGFKEELSRIARELSHEGLSEQRIISILQLPPTETGK